MAKHVTGVVLRHSRRPGEPLEDDAQRGIVAQHHRQWAREEVMRVVSWWWALLCLLYGYCPVLG